MQERLKASHKAYARVPAAENRHAVLDVVEWTKFRHPPLVASLHKADISCNISGS